MRNQKIFFSLLIVLAALPLAAQEYITVYKDCNFNGASQRMDVGSYIDVQLGVGNDAISSIRIGRGVKVTVFSDNNFQGSSATFYDDQQCFDKTWNDKISSLRVERTSDSPNYDRNRSHNDRDYSYNNNNNYNDNQVVLYEDSDFRGRDHVYTCCHSWSVKDNFPTNRISSIRVPEGLRLTLYTGDRQTGYSRSFTANVALLDSRLNDKVMSIKVENVREETGSEAPPGGYGNSRSKKGYDSGSTTEVRLYRDCDYGGAYMSLGQGAYGVSSLTRIGNDALSSLKVPVGLKVLLYSDDNFRGDMTTIYVDTKCLPREWNDKVSSLIIRGVND